MAGCCAVSFGGVPAALQGAGGAAGGITGMRMNVTSDLTKWKTQQQVRSFRRKLEVVMDGRRSSG